MKINHSFPRDLTVILLALMFLLSAQTVCLAAKKDKKKGYVMTEVELQSELMSYADRFASIITGAFEDYETLNPKPQARQVILSDLVYSLSSIYTIAAEPNPQVGLLDMVTVTTLGRIIYEDNMRRKYGKSIEVLVAGFRQMEKDIWSISAKVLTSEQRGELRQLILYWRKNNPDKVVYNYLRFSNFAAQRRDSTLVKKVQAGGLFKKDSKPFDIKEYQDTIVEVTTLVDSTNRLFGTVGLEELLPQLVKAVDQVGNEGEEIIDHSFRQALILILIAMGAYVVARLIYNYLNLKLIKSRT